MKIIELIKVAILFLAMSLFQLEGMEVAEQTPSIACNELDVLLEKADYSLLLAKLDNAVAYEKIDELDWAIAKAVSVFNVPLLHWVIYHRLAICTGLISSDEIEGILCNILCALIRTKMDEIVCCQLNGNRAGLRAYEILRLQYDALLLGRFKNLDRLEIVNFKETCEAVFNLFETGVDEAIDKIFTKFATPLWVGHVGVPFFGGRVLFSNPTVVECTWSLADGAMRADITEERKKVFVEFKALIAEKNSWKEFLESTFEDFRNTNEYY